MKIVIDLQGSQTASRDRGIGRYSTALAKAMLRNAKDHDIALSLNASLDVGFTQITADFENLIPENKIHIWQSPTPTGAIQTINHSRQKYAESIRESFLASLSPDIVHISSLFEGFSDNAITSIGLQEPNLLTSTTLYDLIPLIHKDKYMQLHPNLENWYQEKIEHLKRSNLCLAISASSRKEAIDYLNISPESIVNISSAVDDIFKPIHFSPSEEKSLRNKHALTKPFIMYTGGFDPRKNIDALIRSFALLPGSLRQKYQLAIVCAAPENERAILQKLIASLNLNPKDVIFTGYVPNNDLVSLYNLCDLFIFPSLHEGFGLPALEAMSCGAPTIGSNTSSIPEVIGREDALFDPYNDQSIVEKIFQTLIDDAYRNSLKTHAHEQAKKFSWDDCAKRAISAFEELYESNNNTTTIYINKNDKLKLAYISPLPPAKSGIANYSYELLPELAKYYDIIVVVNQTDIEPINDYCCISIENFKHQAHTFDRIIYQFGNSHFHDHMFALLEQYPGIVTLHDFFLSGIIAHMEAHNSSPNKWSKELYHAHGYSAVQSRFHAKDTADIVYQYPCNLSVLEDATGIICHSEFSMNLAQGCYQANAADYWTKIPHLRKPPVDKPNHKQLKQSLGFSEEDFIVCSFGFLAPTKSNHLLLDAWNASKLSKQHNCLLVFVGALEDPHYQSLINKLIKDSALPNNIKITGFNTSEQYNNYLSITDLAVQLRAKSRGETSGAVLDCMNYGIATIVNANGSMAELPKNCVKLIADQFETNTLKSALEELSDDTKQRRIIGENAKKHIFENHSPEKIGHQYFEAIEHFYRSSATTKTRLLKSLALDKNLSRSKIDQLALCDIITFNQYPKLYGKKQIFIDVSEFRKTDLQSGMQNPIRKILNQLFINPPEGYRIEPVYATHEHEYFYAREFALTFLNCPSHVLEDRPIEPKPGDIFLGLDLNPHIVPCHKHYLQHLRQLGVKVFFVIYDLLPFTHENYFLPNAKDDYHRWLNTVTQSNGAICISKATAVQLENWMNSSPKKPPNNFSIGFSHIGCDLSHVPQKKSASKNKKMASRTKNNNPTILMVGTVEPRKGHLQALEAFEILWQNNREINLVIVGKEGWMVEDLIERINTHPENGKRLFWFNDCDDEALIELYDSTHGTLIASEAEGFGLPLIEAAHHKCPILARDIPVFREIAGNYASYFPDDNSADLLAQYIEDWLALLKQGKAIPSNNMPYLTWKECTEQLVSLLLDQHNAHWL
jgi:glycosyltransferase involved in cell wall biosynthesis